MEESNTIALKSVKDLFGKKFYIPAYQRGYRWGKQEITDLLNDINDFLNKKNKNYYCLQPITVKKKEESCWEVIDGQQRLTAIKIILLFWETDQEKDRFQINYENRKAVLEDRETFLEEIKKEMYLKNIDFYHMHLTYYTIEEWFKGNERENIKKRWIENKWIENKWIEKVKFIWYETIETNPIKIFTRLNIGKIALTNAELIKALFLGESNFEGEEIERIKSQQQEIAAQWDAIEYQLQEDEFWLFLNNEENEQITRIDFIFNLIRESNLLNIQEEYKLNDNHYASFRYFEIYFKMSKNKHSKLKEVWAKVKQLFMTFNEWYNDVELYHYVGYLITIKEATIKDLFSESKGKTKRQFKETLCQKIFVPPKIEELIYPAKEIKSVLLLFNVQTVINKCIKQKESSYKLSVYYKFPFHLYKRERWDVEHIASQKDNELETEQDKKEWLLSAYLSPMLGKELKNEIGDCVNNKGEFEALKTKIMPKLSYSDEPPKDGIGNLTLLDSKTNRGYKNALFSVKRRWIIGKEKGERIVAQIKDREIKEKKEVSSIAFVPICTRNVFLKYYSPCSSDSLEWSRIDAEAYLEEIKETLKKFQKEQSDDINK